MLIGRLLLVIIIVMYKNAIRMKNRKYLLASQEVFIEEVNPW